MEHKRALLGFPERGQRMDTVFVSVQTNRLRYRSLSSPKSIPLFLFRMAEGPTTSRLCLVCSETTFGCHFGVDACRACAAFFRRTIIERKVYVCKTGGLCRIDKTVGKPLCRKCRLKKCLEKGMQSSGVQLKPGEVDIVNDDPNPISIQTETLGEGKMFEKIFANYRELRIIRKATERALDPESYMTVDKSGPFAGYSCGKQENWLLFFRAHTPSVIEFVANSIEGFNDLQEDERLKLLKSFMVYFFWIDAGFRTFKLLPRDQFHRRCLISETTYLDAEQTHIMFDVEKIPSFLINDVNKLLDKELSGDRQRSLYMAYDMQLRDEEFAALVGLLFWNTTVEGCSEAVHQVIRKQRARIYEELGKFYRKSEILDPFVRIGELLNIQNAILVETIRCREDLEMFKIFEAFEKFDSFYQMIRDAH